MIRLEKISKKYGSRVLFSNFSYRFEPTGLYKICGQNGRGKTTLLKILGGYTSHKGNIYFGKRRMSSSLAKGLFSSSLVYRNYLDLHQQETLEAAIDKLLKIDRLDYEKLQTISFTIGLKELGDEKVADLSKGEKSRLATALTLAREAKCFLLDEPFDSLDHENQLILKGILSQVADQQLIIYTSHDDLARVLNEVVIDLDHDTGVAVAPSDIIESPGKVKLPSRAGRVYLENNARIKNSLNFVAIFLNIIFGLIAGLMGPDLIAYLLPPSDIAARIDSDYGRLVFPTSSELFLNDVIKKLESKDIDYYPSIFLETITYNEKEITIDGLFANMGSHGPLLLSEELFDVTVPDGKFLVTSSLKSQIEFSDWLNQYGYQQNPLEHITFNNLTYGGTVESKQSAFVVKRNNVAAAVNFQDVINQEVLSEVLYDRAGQELNRDLAEGEVALYHDPSSGEELPERASLFSGALSYPVVAYTTNSRAIDRIVVSNQTDIYRLYSQTAVRIFPSDIDQLFPLVLLSEKSTSPYAAETTSLKSLAIDDYRRSINEKIVVEIIIFSIAGLGTLSYAIFYAVFAHGEKRSYLEQLDLLGYRSEYFELIKNMKLWLAGLGVATVAFIYRMLGTASLEGAQALNLIPFAFLALASMIAVFLCHSRYPLEKVVVREDD